MSLRKGLSWLAAPGFQSELSLCLSSKWELEAGLGVTFLSPVQGVAQPGVLCAPPPLPQLIAGVIGYFC